MSFIRNTLCKVFSLINWCIPKSNIIVFNSFPNYADNSWELYSYIVNSRPDICSKYKIYWGVNYPDIPPVFAKDFSIDSFDKKTVKGLWIFLRSKFVFTTHGYFAGVRSGRNQIQINLWHGCGYKDITRKDRIYIGDYAIATSELYKKIHAEVFSLSTDKVLVSGLPRNDVLFEDSSCLSILGIDEKQYKKIIIWMPTYRKAAFGHSGVDGAIDSFGLGSLTASDYKKINSKLNEENYLLIIKPHPLESLSFMDNMVLSNILCIKTDDLFKKNIKLYSLLKETDALLSDYSSVIVDYLLLDKPIAMVLSDAEEYKSSRGFVFDSVEEYFPGPIVRNNKELLDYICNFDEINKKWVSKRRHITKLFHSNLDCKNCERVCELFFPMNR